MKFYETQFDEYIERSLEFDIHPELRQFENSIPDSPKRFRNMILYGASGVGKYTQMLRFIKKYSPSELKYDKKMSVQTEKYEHSYRISDIHYEIDMMLLGCNSKLIWHDIFSQIVDIVSLKSCKFGIIVCKNFHSIHSELLEIFYSYIQQYNNDNLTFQIKFVILTEQISFIPNNILNNSQIVRIERPSTEIYQQMGISNEIAPSCILNLKELNLIKNMDDTAQISTDIFELVCNTIIQKISDPSKFKIIEFREVLYDILVYNLDVYETVWYIITHFIQEGKLDANKLSVILNKSYKQLLQYNNNYRPIYHLESIFINILIQIHNFKFENDFELPTKMRKRASNTRLKSD